MSSARSQAAVVRRPDRETDSNGSEEHVLYPLVAMLAADVLAIHVDVPAGSSLDIDLAVDGAPVALEQRTMSHVLCSGDSTGRLTVARIGDAPVRGDATVTVRTAGREVELGPAQLKHLCVDLRSLMRERLAALTAAERAGVLELLVEAATDDSAADPLGMSMSMALAREGLREPLPLCVVSRDEPQGLHFDAVLGLSDRSFYIRGWALDAQAPLTRLTVVSPEGARAELLPGAHRVPRPDVDSFYEHPHDCSTNDIGFIAHVALSAPSRLSDGWVLEMENALGVGREVKGPIVSTDPLTRPRRDPR